ncbi:uncharacterized protein METZ01_LOCUS441926, partial [marine metagenome]
MAQLEQCAVLSWPFRATVNNAFRLILCCGVWLLTICGAITLLSTYVITDRSGLAMADIGTTFNYEAARANFKLDVPANFNFAFDVLAKQA